MREPSRKADTTCEKSIVRVIHIRRCKRTSILAIDAIIGLYIPWFATYISACPVKHTPQLILLNLPATNMRSRRASPSVRRDNFDLNLKTTVIAAWTRAGCDANSDILAILDGI
jgi:hypothetical protein